MPWVSPPSRERCQFCSGPRPSERELSPSARRVSCSVALSQHPSDGEMEFPYLASTPDGRASLGTAGSCQGSPGVCSVPLGRVWSFPLGELTALPLHGRSAWRRPACSVPSSGERRRSWLWPRPSQVPLSCFCRSLSLEWGDLRGQMPPSGEQSRAELVYGEEQLGREHWHSSGCAAKLVPSTFLLTRALSTRLPAAIPMRAGRVGDGQLSWCSDLLLVVAELLSTVDTEVPAAPEPSAPFEEPLSPAVPTAPPLQWDQKKSECVVCMEQEVRPRNTPGAGAGAGASSTAPRTSEHSLAWAVRGGGKQGRA